MFVAAPDAVLPLLLLPLGRTVGVAGGAGASGVGGATAIRRELLLAWLVSPRAATSLGTLLNFAISLALSLSAPVHPSCIRLSVCRFWVQEQIVLAVAHEASHFHPTLEVRSLPLGVVFEEAESSLLVIFLAASSLDSQLLGVGVMESGLTRAYQAPAQAKARRRRLRCAC